MSKSDTFKIDAYTVDEIEEGAWFETKRGFLVRVASRYVPDYLRVASSMSKRAGGRRVKQLSDLNLPQMAEIARQTAARVTFKEFKGPDGQAKLALNGTTFENTVEDRVKLLELLPGFSDEIEDFTAEMDERASDRKSQSEAIAGN